MDKAWKNMGTWLARSLVLALLIGAGACGRKTGNEGGFAYTTDGLSAELTGVTPEAVTGYVDGRLEVPDRLGGQRVRSVAAGAFRQCADAVSVKFPRRVSRIGAGAFEGCTNLVWAELPSRLERLEDGLFRGCTRMEESDIPDRVEAIGAHAYDGCRQLARVAFPEALRSVGEGAFSGCSSLKGLDLPAGVGEIGPRAFSGCASLESVVLPEGLANIPDGAFEGCSGLESVRIPPGVTNIGARAFAGCSSLKRVVLPAGLVSMGRECFQGAGLESMTLPPGVSVLGDGALSGCATLDAVEVAEGNPAFSVRDGVLFRDGGAELVLFPGARSGKYAVPGGVERIGAAAFRGSLVETVDMPGSVKAVGESAFRDCRWLRRVVLGEGVEEIGGGAFSGCGALWECEIPESVGETGDGLFSGCDGLLLVVAPDKLAAETTPREAWQVPPDCTVLSRSAWEETRQGRRTGVASDPFFGLYSGEDLETVSFEGTVLAASAVPDPEENDYDHCLYALLVELDSVFSTTPPATNIARVVLVNAPIMHGRTVIRANEFAPGDRISCQCAEYDAMPQGIREIQLSDDIQSFEHQPYYPLRIAKIREFRETGNRDFAKREISVLPIQSLPRDGNTAAARRERIRKEMARVESELARHGGSFEAWKEEYRPVAEEYDRLCRERYAGWTGDSYFAAGCPESEYLTREYIDGILPYKKYLEENGIDLVVVRVPSKGDFAARVLAAGDFRENPAWVEHYRECLENDIEIVDPMPEMWKARFDFPLFYFYQDSREYHPFEGASFVMAKEIAKVLERYPHGKSESEIVLQDAVSDSCQPRFFWPGGNGRFDPAANLVFRKVVRDGEPIGGLVPDSGSPFLFISNSQFWYPGRFLGASVPGYAAYFLQAIPDWFYQDGANNPIVKNLVGNPQLLHSRRAVVMAAGPDAWRGFPVLPKYIQDRARRITLEKTLNACSGEVALRDHGSFWHSEGKDGSVWFESNDAPPEHKVDHFDLAFGIPAVEGKHTCMIRVNLGKTRTPITMEISEDGQDAITDTAFLPVGGGEHADFFVPLREERSEVEIRVRLHHPEKGCVLDNIELWYY